MNFTVEGPNTFLKVDGGWMSKIGSTLLFFGDKNSELARLQANHSTAKFVFLNQVHSDQIHVVTRPPDISSASFSPSDWPEGDAHITEQSGLALCVRTADCIPILISAGPFVAAIHAGWRGLESEVILKTVLKMRALGVETRDLRAVIGPHIGTASFEVEREVAEKLNAVFRKLRFNPAPISYPHPSEDHKRMVDMSILAHAQLIQGGVSEKDVTVVKVNTFTSPDFHSFRRDKGSGRQISFILKV